MTWQSSALDDLLDAVRVAAPYPKRCVDLLRHETERAQRAALDGVSVEGVAQALALAAGAAAAAGLAQLRSDDEADGVVTLIEPGAPARRLEVPPDVPGFTLGDWITGWSAALLARDALSALTLCTSEVLLPAERAHGPDAPVWSAHCGLLAAATRSQDSLDAWLPAAAEAIGRVGPQASDAVRARLQPAHDIVAALAQRDAAALRAALVHAFAVYAATPVDPARSADPARAWPLEAAALAALAFDDGLLGPADVAAIAEGGPPSLAPLIQGAARPALSCAEVSWPVAAVLSADEARWFLDLRGLPRDGRHHVVSERDGRLFASYTAHGALAPLARATFLLVDRPEDAGDVPLALDAGELLALAERFSAAHQMGAETVPEALGCADAALARVPDGALSVPEHSIISGLGRSVLAAEPGRLRRARMEAYRRGLAGAVRPTSPPEPPDGAPSAAIEGATEALAAAVAPLLRQLAEDGALSATLTPTEDDLAAIFAPDAVNAVADALSRRGPPGPVDAGRYHDLMVAAAPAALLATRNALSDRFPERYRAIADRLLPHRVWVAWRYVKDPDGHGTSYDGLVWTGTRWVWLPKPWRLLDA